MEIFNVKEYINQRDNAQTEDIYFEELEINISRKCNRTCCICPQSNKKYRKINSKFNQFMDIELFKKIINEVKTLDFKFNIDVIGNGEPTLNPYFFDILNILNTVDKFIRITTNGDNFRDEEFLKKYFNYIKSDNINTYISVYNKKDLNFFMDIKSYYKNHNIHIKDMFIEDTDPTLIFNDKMINNRSGYVNMKTPDMVNDSCNYPFYSLYIDTNGDAQYCPHNWVKELVIGNINNNSLLDLWFMDTYHRRIMLENKRREFGPCKKCNVHGCMIGNKKREYFK